MITVMRLTVDDDVERLVDEINQAIWDDANDMTVYSAQALAVYLNTPDTLFLSCHAMAGSSRTLLGIASARLEIKPYDEARWLYVDEVDVCVDQRRKGAGKAIMEMLIGIARDERCGEVWLGTEVDNEAANALYRSLKPSEVEAFVGYTFQP